MLVREQESEGSPPRCLHHPSILIMMIIVTVYTLSIILFITLTPPPTQVQWVETACALQREKKHSMQPIARELYSESVMCVVIVVVIIIHEFISNANTC